MAANPKAKYEITADDKTAAAWRSAERHADAAGKRISGAIKMALAGVSVAAFASATKAAFEFGDEIGKGAVKAGIGVTQFSELAFAARMADVDITGLSTALKKMQVGLSEASTGGKQQLETLKALGLTLDELKRLAPDKQFERLADAIMSLRDPADRARAATALFGKAGADLLPMFEQGAEGIRKAREEAEKFGLAFSEETVKALQEGDDALKRLTAAWDGFIAKIAVGTVKLAEAADLIDKDKIGELQDQLAMVNRELQEASMPMDGGTFDPELYKRLSLEAQALERQIASLNDTYTRGGGARRGRGKPAAPGFEAAKKDDPKPSLDIDPQIQAMERWADLSNSADHATQEWLWSTTDLEEALLDIPEPILKVGDSLIQTQALQEEFTRSMFNNFSDLFMSIGTGSDNMAEQFLNTIKRMLSDRATMALFDFLGLGGDSGSSGGGLSSGIVQGEHDWLNSILSGVFGGGKAKGGPLQQGKWYVAGEHGPEPIWGGGPGAYAMGYGRGGGNVTLAPVYNIDARGASMELTKVLPEILKRNNQQLESTIVTKIKRRQYNLG